MNDNLTQIAVVQDRSGSMSRIAETTVRNFNEFVNKQKLEPGDARLMLVQFDHEYIKVYDKPLNEVGELTVNQSYIPRGSTAMLDAIGRTIDDLGKSLAATPEHERPGRVVVVITTDGEENSSTVYNVDTNGHHIGATRVAAMVEHQQEHYNWRFIFLGANQDAVLTAQALHIPKGQALTYATTNAGVTGSSAAMSHTMSVYRSAPNCFDPSAMPDFSEDERTAAQQ